MNRKEVWESKSHRARALQGDCPMEEFHGCTRDCPIYEDCKNDSWVLKASAKYEERKIKGELSLDEILGLQKEERV